MQTESKVIILLSSQSKIMASEEKKILRLIPTMLFKFHCLITLKSWMGQRTLREENLGIGIIIIDSALIEGKHFEPDRLPPVESTDLLCHLVLETSFYTQKQFKAFRSLKAYNQMVSGFI